ncbi:MAG: LysM peptidoglycan-binding domain-containing protein, partial [Chloroflexi bacterium]
MGRKAVLVLGVVVLLGMAVVGTGCTRAKSAGPAPTKVGSAGPQAVGGTPSPAAPLSDEEAMNATAAALAATATAGAGAPQATPTPTAKKPATPTPTKKPATTPATKVAPTPTTAPAGQATPKPTAPPATPQIYVVQPGDNLFRIALRYNLLYTAVARANNL